MILDSDKITEIFYLMGDFCKEFEAQLSSHLIGNKPKRPKVMSNSEVITIMILFHHGSFRNFKHFYLGYVKKHMVNEFPNTVSYNRFTELM